MPWFEGEEIAQFSGVCGRMCLLRVCWDIQRSDLRDGAWLFILGFSMALFWTNMLGAKSPHGFVRLLLYRHSLILPFYSHDLL